MATLTTGAIPGTVAGHARGAAVLGALGVVFGDIGTSPLYALREAATAASAAAPLDTVVLGILSLVVWALILVISIKYCVFVLRADNRGEGGIIALEGITVYAPRLEAFVLPATLVILVGLFAVQRVGTGHIGRIFGPVILIW